MFQGTETASSVTSEYAYSPSQHESVQPSSLMHSVRDQERIDGVRFVWNCWPFDKEDMAKLILPLGVFHTPIKPRFDIPPFRYEPVYCAKCRAVLNPFCQADFRSKGWICCFCANRNTFPPQYAGASEQQRPAELMGNFTTMEYISSRPVMPPIYLFVLDTCLDNEELFALKDAVVQALLSLPKSTLVGLITFGRTVAIHDLSMDIIKHSFIFKGTKDISAKVLQDQLGIGRYSGVLQPLQQIPKNQSNEKFPNRFLQPLEICEKFIADIITNITSDPWPTAIGKRPLRSTGAALNTAVGLVENSFPGTGARILLFVGGPCTQGPGMVVGDEFKIPIRSHHDLIMGNAPFVVRATQYYETLAQRAVSNSHTIDIFSCALDQTGLHEMKSCCNLTGGQMFLGDNFNSQLFSQNMQVLFNPDQHGDLPVALNASVEVKASKNVKICGCLGPAVPQANVRSSSVSDNNFMGTGGTSEWRCCCLLNNTTLCFVFETSGQETMVNPQENQFFIQFMTTYQHATGQKRIRVTTVNRRWCEPNSPDIAAGFDQEAAAVLMSRMAVTRLETEPLGTEVRRWIDRTLVRTCNRFGKYTTDDPNTFGLPENFAHLPTTIFHLRRSQLLQTSNTSLDESAFYRHCVLKQDVVSANIIIQPVLYAYSLQGPPLSVMLDSTSLQPDRILLLDTFFHIVIYRGETIMHWINAGYDKMPEYANFASLLKAPVEDAEVVLSHRFPMPRYVVTEQGGSQARFLLSKVNPSQAQTMAPFGWQQPQEGVTSVLTEDVNLQVFMEHLRKLAVSSSLNH
ncbi:protein transport protein Sec23A-like [Paramacrobiotus metropolitanus]|uniref:protein transport protein Sec23A-like n=1 Tax=Paramacrobiotus metropolitanus TaxID=2943436 RepID=UPI0024458714|nr:protein transport protein Sec23A-like [Paramacrobiotus metropolitanus]